MPIGIQIEKKKHGERSHALGFQNIFHLKSYIRANRIYQIGSLAHLAWMEPIWLCCPSSGFYGIQSRILRKIYWKTPSILFHPLRVSLKIVSISLEYCEEAPHLIRIKTCIVIAKQVIFDSFMSVLILMHVPFV